MYTHLSIGTAKPTKREMKKIPHHLFDFLDPKEECNVAQWKDLAKQTITNILARESLPVICGGTGLFINALTQNFSIPHIAPDPQFRKKMEKLSGETLWKKLSDVDPVEAERIGKHNTRYLIRALEVYTSSGVQKSVIANTKEPDYSALIIGATFPRKQLYERIHQRAEVMKKLGFINEVRDILRAGYTLQDPALQSTGYEEAVLFLHGKLEERKVWEELKKQTRNYAKRQLTWWRKDTRVQWFHSQTLRAVTITDGKF
jgi:tRNA dimethylallyltransferase